MSQIRQFLGKLLRHLVKNTLPLMKDVLTRVIKSVLVAL